MTAFFIIISLCLGLVLLAGIIALFCTPKAGGEHSVVLPKPVLIIGIIGNAAFLLLSLFVVLSQSLSIGAIVLCAFSALCSCLIIAFINCRITYNDDFFEAKNFWGVKRTYAFKEISGISGKTGDVIFSIGKKTVRVDGLARGKYEFIAHAKKQYRKTHNGLAIPEIRRKTDIFNGNVENPGEFIFFYILIGLICIGTIIFLALVSRPPAEDDFKYAQLSFIRHETEDDDLLLYAEGENMHYDIPAYEQLLTPADAFLAAARAEESFSVSYVVYDEADEPYNGLYSIADSEGRVYLSAEAVQDWRWGGAWAIYLLLGVLGLVWLAFTFVSIYVGRNPHKFSRGFIRLFFKDGYIINK